MCPQPNSSNSHPPAPCGRSMPGGARCCAGASPRRPLSCRFRHRRARTVGTSHCRLGHRPRATDSRGCAITRAGVGNRRHFRNRSRRRRSAPLNHGQRSSALLLRGRARSLIRCPSGVRSATDRTGREPTCDAVSRLSAETRYLPEQRSEGKGRLPRRASGHCSTWRATRKCPLLDEPARHRAESVATGSESACC
jgi:hypothetical protein